MRYIAMIMLVVSLAGCRFWPFGREERSRPEEIPAPMARRALNDARQEIFRGRPENIERAIVIADRVIRRSIESRYIWEGWSLKASAYEAAGELGNAAEAATNGINSIISQQAGALTEQSIVGLQILLPVYIRNAVAQSGEVAATDALDTWRRELQIRFERGEYRLSEDVTLAGEEFERMYPLVAQYAAMLKPEVQVRQLIRRFIVFYNTQNSVDMLALAAPGSPLESTLDKNGVQGLSAKNMQMFQLGSGVDVSFLPVEPVPAAEHAQEQDGSEHEGVGEMDAVPVAALATADLFAIAPGGWTQMVERVEFSIIKNEEGRWLLTEINGLP